MGWHCLIGHRITKHLERSQMTASNLLFQEGWNFSGQSYSRKCSPSQTVSIWEQCERQVLFWKSLPIFYPVIFLSVHRICWSGKDTLPSWKGQRRLSKQLKRFTVRILKRLCPFSRDFQPWLIILLFLTNRCRREFGFKIFQLCFVAPELTFSTLSLPLWQLWSFHFPFRLTSPVLLLNFYSSWIGEWYWMHQTLWPAPA